MTFIAPQASHYINGAYAEDPAGDPMRVISPATEEVLCTLHAATPAIIGQALESAKAAQQVWAGIGGAVRARILRRAAGIMRSRNHALGVLETWDTGKPLQETLVADAASGADALEYFAAHAATMTGEHIQLPGGDFSYTIRDPLGVCAGLGAWNYPIQIACWKAAPALACGNAMVFKPSEITPLSALQLAAILTEAGAPPGLFNVIQGAAPVGAALATDPRVAKVSLTGSVPTGRKVYAAAAAGIKHVTMELGGKSPLIIFDDADVENAVSGAIMGNFYSAGQVCSNGTRVFVQGGIKSAFLKRLTERLAGAVIGDPMDKATNFGPMVSEAQLETVLRYIARGQAEGARLLTGGTRLKRKGFYLSPTIFADVTDDMTIAREEIFGPVMSVLDFDIEQEVIARANATEFGLAAGVFTRDVTRAHRVVQSLDAGICYVNCYNLTPVEVPFGGVKASGVGRENSRAALEHYSTPRTVYIAMKDVEAPF